jgi:hypothetical protein
VNGVDRLLFLSGVDGFEHNGGCDGARNFHRLAARCERRGINGGRRDVIKKLHRTLIGNVYPRVDERTNGAESRHVLKGHERGEGTAAVQQFLRLICILFKTGRWISRFW